MTDEQLRAMARRVLHLVAGLESDGCYWGMDTAVGTQDEIEAEAVAILREAFEPRQELIFPNADDPTQSFVATT